MNPLLFLAPERLIAKTLVGLARGVASNRFDADLRAGRLPVIPDPPILLVRGETCHWLEPGVTALEPKTVTVARASLGVRVRVKVMPGVSFGGRVASLPAIKERQLVTTARGDLVVTSKRLVMTGSSGVLELPLAKLISCHDGGDCVVLALNGKRAQVYLTAGKRADHARLTRLILVSAQQG